jgi:hypothetical protein
MFRVLKFALTNFLKREDQPSPFFDKNGQPLAPVYILTLKEREDLRPLCGKKRDWQTLNAQK